jgi:primosomal protein N' (replication factor Y)
VRYHARDMAILRAFRASAASASWGARLRRSRPSGSPRTGKATKLRLPDRARAQAMPRVELVDLRRIGAGPTGDKRISLPLHRAIEETLAAGEQAILFLNRRGFAPSVRCEACGELVACPSCSVALTFHKRGGERPSLPLLRLRARRCPPPAPSAAPKASSSRGSAPRRLEETLGAAFPSARIARLDRDVASGKAVEKVLARMRAREIDMLVGTQMVAKGHDLPHVTLVGVINADAALSIPDFRAAERAFQLLVQVAGRAGRGDARGASSYRPTTRAPAVVFAASHDVGGFVERELADRKELGYPPFTRVALVRVDAVDEDAGEASVRGSRARGP